jgi:hypothetical protein
VDAFRVDGAPGDHRPLVSTIDSADPPTRSEEIEIALGGLARGTRLQLEPVGDAAAPTTEGPLSALVANQLSGVTHLDTQDS